MKKQMMGRTATILFLAILSVMLFSACTSRNETQQRSGTGTYADFIDSGKVIAVQSGEIFNIVARDLFMARAVPEYAAMADLLEDLRRGRIDAVMTNASYVKQLEDSGIFPEFEYLWVPEYIFINESAPVFYTTELRDKYNEWLTGIKADGTFDGITNRWIGVSLPAHEDIPRFEFTGENGTLRVCDTGNFPPFIYYDANGEPVGFDIDLISRFAQHLGKRLEITMMSYDAIIPYVISGKADMSACHYTITEERGESVLFGAPTVINQAVLIVPKSAQEVSVAVRNYTYFNDKDIAVITGVLTYNTTRAIGGNPVNYNDAASAAEDVRRGRVDGFMTVLTAVQVMAAQLDGFEAIPVPTEIFAAQLAGISNDQSVIDRFNTFLFQIEADGTLDEMKNRWFGDAVNLNAPIPAITNNGQNGILKVATSSDSLPYVFIGSEGELTGFSAELALRFGAYESKTVEFIDMEFGALIPYIVSGRADISLSFMAITEERKQSVLFTNPFYEEQHGILALARSGTAINLTHADFAGKTIGMPTGTIWDGIIEGPLNGVPAYYSDTSSGVEDVRRGRIDGFITDLSAARVLVAMQGNEDLLCVEVPAEIFSAPMGAVSLNQNIVDRFNNFLSEIEADGTLDEMQGRWLRTMPDANAPILEFPSSGTNGTLRVAASAGSMPFAFMDANSVLNGYSVELARRFAAHEGMGIEFSEMDFGGLIPYIISGRADLAIADISITEERKLSVLFTDPIYYDQGGIITLRPGGAVYESTGGGFIKWLQTGIQRNLITDNRWKLITDGLSVTMQIALFAMLIGTILGGFICWVLTRKNRFINWLGRLYCGLIHGTPIVVLLMLTYYIIFGGTRISNVVIAIAAFTMVMGANIAQNLKGAIDTIDPVEIEAARSIGFSAFKAFLSVTLPQAIRRALPGYTNGFVELVKATAIVGYVAIQDMMRAADIIRSRTFDAFFPLLFVALIYLLLTTACVQLFKLIMRKAGVMQ